MPAIENLFRGASRWALLLIAAHCAAVALGEPIDFSDAGPPVSVSRDLAYVTQPHPRQHLDVVTPLEPAAEKLPVIVYFHGGGWTRGQKSNGLRFVETFVETGDYAGVSVGYRLTQHARWPAQGHDCKAALRWVRANADRFGIDPTRAAVIGHSAGGHLAAWIGATGDAPETNGALGDFGDMATSVSCVVNYAGPSDLPAVARDPELERYNKPDSIVSRLLGGRLTDKPDVARQASPVTYVSADDPAFLLVHGTADRVVPHKQAEILHAALRAAGVESTLLSVDGGGHSGFDGPELRAAIDSFVRRWLHGAEVALTDRVFKPGE